MKRFEIALVLAAVALAGIGFYLYQSLSFVPVHHKATSIIFIPPESTEIKSQPSVAREKAGGKILLVAGDIADCNRGNFHEATAAILANESGAIAVLGDTTYPNGTPEEFANCYGPSWGKYKERTFPAVGNHEYKTADAAGYFDYFGAAAGERGKGYYSYDIDDWHVVVLNTNCAQAGGCGKNSLQGRWLSKDLSAHKKLCTLAYMHHPRFASALEHGSNPSVGPLWDEMYAAGVDVVLAGHVHAYERLAPQDPSGNPDPERGIREFIVGTGGATSLHAFGASLPTSDVRQAGTFGVLKLTLHPRSYDWEFLRAAGLPFTDSGSGVCH